MGTKKSEWVLFLGFVGKQWPFPDEDSSEESGSRMMDFSRKEASGFLWGHQASGDLRLDSNQQVSQTPSSPRSMTSPPPRPP